MTVKRPPSKIQRPDEAKVAFRGKLFEVWQWQHYLSDGTSVTFEALSRPDTVLVLPVVDNNQILFAEEEQPGMKRMLRAIGGRIEKGEDPMVATHRELLEESGYSAGRLVLWDAWQPVNKIDWAVYIFIAHDTRKVAEQQLDSTELIKIVRLNVDDLFEATPEIDDYELLYKLNAAKVDAKELFRVKKLFQTI